jgi:hypothetical protein
VLNEILRKARYKKAKLQLVRSEGHEKLVAKKAKKAKAVIDSHGTTEPEVIEAYNIMKAYHRMMCEFDGESRNYEPNFNNRAKSFWMKVRKVILEAELDPEVFLKAQFAWFSKVHGCAPEHSQLTTQNAVLRAKDFALTQFNSRVVGNGKLMSVEMVDLFKVCEAQIRQLQRVHSINRRQVYEQFVLTGMIHISPSFLSLDPVYQELVNG